MISRTGRPKLALALPAATTTSHAMRSPALRSPLTPVSPSPISPTARNTRLNQRGFSVLQPPTFAYAQSSETKSILKKGQKPNLTAGKKIQFRDDPAVMCLSPVPEDYHGTYVKMSRDERRWGKRTWDREAGWRIWSGHLLTCILCGPNRSYLLRLWGALAWVLCYSTIGICWQSPRGFLRSLKEVDDFHDWDVLYGYETLLLVVLWWPGCCCYRCRIRPGQRWFELHSHTISGGLSNSVEVFCH